MDAVASQGPSGLPPERRGGRNPPSRGRPTRGGRRRGSGPSRHRNRPFAGDLQDLQHGQISPNQRLPLGNGTDRRRRRRHDAQRATNSSTADRETTAVVQMGSGGTELSARLINQMNRGKLECIVCLVTIHRNQSIWSCDVCYTITHLHCARKWAYQGRSISDDADTIVPDLVCPSCRATGEPANSIVYRCYCRRYRNPELVPGITPGSCGEFCHKPMGVSGSNCPHRCQAICHPGPCAPCMAPAPPIKCHCGKKNVFRHCGEAIPANGVSCDMVCGQKHWSCDHACEKKCHPVGDEGECEVVVQVTCYCGKESADLRCADAANGFACGQPCGKRLECGNHTCQQNCHRGDCPPCKTSPAVLKECACGKTKLSESQLKARKSCLDPVPSCGAQCERQLGCLGKHRCKKVCGHEGDCGVCDKTILAECRCGVTALQVPCGEDLETLRSKLICDKKCNERLLCKRHNCQTVCCMFRKRKAAPRQNVVSSSVVWGGAPGVGRLYAMTNAERRREGHRCERRCEKDLACGLHTCDWDCGHSGDCPSCGLLLWEPLLCSCGAESIPPPIACGTAPPACRRPCSRIRECGHACPQSCHPGECAPCSQILPFACVGGHNEMRFVPCHIGRKGIKCFRSCGKPLLCGIHACRKPCHDGAPEECETSTVEGCTQVCGLPRKQCKHSCMSLCHPGMLCPDTPCQELITVSCPCGRRKEMSKCLRGGMGGSKEENDDIRLQCDDECAAKSRVRAFASAIGRDGNQGNDQESGSQAEEQTKYSDFLLQFAEREPRILAFFEEELGHIVQGKIKKYTFESMPQLHRLVLHHLSEFYRLETESMGRFPNRHTVARHAGAGIKPVSPRPLLSEAFAVREKERKRARQLGSGKTLIIHVASTTSHHATAQIEERVKQELRSHSGAFRILGRSTMTSSLVGVSVEFSTSERAMMVKATLTSRPGVTVENPAVKSLNEGSSSKHLTTSDASNNESWDDEVMEYGGHVGHGVHGTLQGLLPQVSSLVIDENVPDSWDD